MTSDPPKDASEADDSGRTPVRSLTTDDLFRGEKLLIIRHAGEDYRLMLTRNNRLILQK